MFVAEVWREFRGEALDGADVVHGEHLARAAGAEGGDLGVARGFVVDG